MSTIKDWRVLVVEDEEDSMELVQGIFQFYEIHCIGTPTAEDALQTLKSFSPTMVIIDLALPQMNGWELLKEIKNRPNLSDVLCIATTAYHTPSVANEAIEAGFDAYFPKPIDATSFIRELEVIVSDYN